MRVPPVALPAQELAERTRRDRRRIGVAEAALGVVLAAREAQKKMREAVGTGKLEREPAHSLAERAIAIGIISADEGRRLKLAAKAQDAVRCRPARHWRCAAGPLRAARGC